MVCCSREGGWRRLVGISTAGRKREDGVARADRLILQEDEGARHARRHIYLSSGRDGLCGADNASREWIANCMCADLTLVEVQVVRRVVGRVLLQIAVLEVRHLHAQRRAHAQVDGLH